MPPLNIVVASKIKTLLIVAVAFKVNTVILGQSSYGLSQMLVAQITLLVGF